MQYLLAYLSIGLPYVAALALGLTIATTAVLCYSRPGIAIGLVMGIFSLEALYMQLGGVQLGIALYYTDFVMVFVFAVAIVRYLSAADVPRIPKAWLIYCLVFFISLATGLVSYGSAAGVQARGYFYSVAAALCVIAFPVTERHARGLINGLTAIAFMLVAVCAYRWTVYYTPLRDLLPEGGTYNPDGAIRVVRSHEALVISQVLAVSIFFSKSSHWLTAAKYFSPVLLAAVIALQHRSVWVALLAGVAVSFMVARSKSASRLSQIALLLAVVLTAALPLAVNDQVSEQVSSSANSALSGKGTAGERMNSWQEIIKNWAKAGPRSIAIGQSFGSDNSRYVEDSTTGGFRKISYIAHNHYVQTLFNFGLIGLIAFIGASVFVVRGLFRLCADEKTSQTPAILLVLVSMQLVYYVPYGTDFLQHLIFGIAMAYVIANRPATTPLAAKKMSSQWGTA